MQDTQTGTGTPSTEPTIHLKSNKSWSYCLLDSDHQISNPDYVTCGDCLRMYFKKFPHLKNEPKRSETHSAHHNWKAN